MTKIDISQAYLFLSRNNWKEEADGCGTSGKKDGTIIKSEMRSYLKENFKGMNGETYSTKDINDLVDRFWNKIDTNTSEKKIAGTSYKDLNGLNKDEEEDLSQKLEFYVAFDNYLKEKLTNPGCFTQGKYYNMWKSEMTTKLADVLKNYINTSNATVAGVKNALDYEFEGIKKELIAKCCAEEYKENLTSSGDLKGLDYDMDSDEVWQQLLNSYLEKLKERTDVDPKTIRDEIQALFNAYIEGNDDKLKEYDYKQDDNSQLNGIQAAKAKKSLLDSLSSVENYKKYPELYKDSIEEYLDGLNVGKYNNVKDNLYADFIASYGDKLDKACKVYDLFYEKNTDWSIIDESTFEKDIQDMLKQKVKEVGKLHDIIQGAVDEVLNNPNAYVDNNGNLITEKIQEWVLNQIVVTAATTKNNKIPVETAEHLYYAAVGIDSSIQKDAAIKTCESLATLGSEHSKIANKYLEQLNDDDLWLQDVGKIMEEFFADIKNVKETSSTTDDTSSSLSKDEFVTNLLNNNKYGYRSINNSSAVCTYYVTRDGAINFVNYNAGNGAFDDSANTALNTLFQNSIKSALEGQYSKLINNLGLSQEDKNKLFNVALFMTLSDTSVMQSMYNEVSLSTVVKALVDVYETALEKMAGNSATKAYILDGFQNGLLAGRSTGTNGSYNANSDVDKNLNDYYEDDSTKGDDDWVYIDSRKESSFSYGGGTGTIIELDKKNHKADNNAVNKACKKILTDYIEEYSSYISATRIIELFKLAQQTAYKNLENTTSNTDPNGTSIYGYGESVNCDKSNTDTRKTKKHGTLYGVNSILINVIYEFEKLLSKEMMSLPNE